MISTSVRFSGRQPVRAQEDLRFGHFKSALIKEVSDSTFDTEVIEASRKQPVMVTFWASWCGPCKKFAERADRLAEEYRGKVAFRRVMTSDYQKEPNGKPVRTPDGAPVKFDVHKQNFRKYGGITFPLIMIFANGQPQRVFSYYALGPDGKPEEKGDDYVIQHGLPVGSPSNLSDHEIKALLNSALQQMGQ